MHSSIEDSIDLAFDTNISNITITGDFNLDISKQASYRKINDLCQHFNLEQIITEPTNYTENPMSIIDLFLVSNKNRVLLSGVGEPFLDQNIRYHCPIYCVYNFDKVITPSFTRHIYLYHRGDYETLALELTGTDWSSLKDDNVDVYAQHHGRLLPTGLQGWPLKFVQHIADASCISPSPAGPSGSCPLHLLHLCNLSFMIGMSNRSCILKLKVEPMFCMQLP